MTYYLLYRKNSNGQVNIYIPAGISGKPKVHMFDDRGIAHRYADYYKAQVKEITIG